MNKNTIKPEMTVEAKARFFSQYWGQPIQTYSISKFSIRKDTVVQGWTLGYLTLKPLSSITDEDLHELQVIEDVFEPGENCFLHVEDDYISCYFKNEWLGGSFKRPLLLVSYQYLQSKGYALPYLYWSVEQMQSAGWIKLLEKGDNNGIK